ncbi:hypothetical protein DB30_00508 [Enhygromyxa salina]|uniref:Peptidase M61 catalytic domain-containing protein n=1 Tax=Enhygromyxa salina TaxID=215803 RepID=A0A0C2CU39_9BACT|nr:hypothetical protein [Enhygromyxa salina]KIG13130.1 hypothetical protein DB30_00508 [Enhygromyxa salina]
MWTSAQRFTCRAASSWLLLLVVVFVCSCAPKLASEPPQPAEDDTERTGAAARWSYEIRVDEALEQLHLGLCIEGPRPTRLRSMGDAMSFVASARVRGGPVLARDGQNLVVETLGEHGCLDLEIDLEAAVRAGGRDTTRRGDSIMLAPDRWLWYPAVVPANINARARFELPKGVAATVPWPHIPAGEADGADGWRRLDHTTFGWNAWIALGRYRPIEFTVAQCEFEVAVLDGQRAASDAGIEAWLRTAALSSAELHGRFPRERVSVVVVPTAGWGDAPVMFGMARRGGGGSVMLILNSDATDAELPGEWVATHELLHLGMPLVADPWMSEGFVTYYTEILRARQGLLGDGESSPPEDNANTADSREDRAHDEQIRLALAALARGFRRGGGGLRTLAHASDNMRSSGGYRRVYWGGAAIAFDLDVSIRAASGGRRSLDDLCVMLQKLALEHRRWPAEELLEMMDAEVARWRAAGELRGEISPSKIVARHLQAKSTPPDVEQLHRLAVEIDSSDIRLLANPIDNVRLREGLFASKNQQP